MSFSSYLFRNSSVALMLLFLFLSVSAQAQTPSDTVRKPAFMEQVKAIVDAEQIRSREKFERGKIESKQRVILEAIRTETQKAGILLRQAPDTLNIKRELEKSRTSFQLVKDGVFVNQGTHHTQRNLAVSSIILEEIAAVLERNLARMQAYHEELASFRFQLDSLSNDSVIFQFPTDSVQVVHYVKSLIAGTKEISPIDSALTRSLVSIEKLIQENELFHFEVNNARSEIEKISNRLTTTLLDREFPNIWEKPMNKRPIGEILRVSYEKEKLAGWFYLIDNPGRLVLLVLILMIVVYFLRSLKSHLDSEKNAEKGIGSQLAVKNPVYAAVVITCCLFQFIFPDPPFVFSVLLWLISGICLTLCFHKYITGFWMHFWIIMLSCFALATACNLVLQASRAERWLMLALEAFGIIYGIYILKSSHKAELREKRILYFIAIFVFIELLALCFNCFGRYNFSKTLFIIGYSGLVVAILFLWTVRFLNEGLAIASEVYQHPDKKLFYINFDKVGNKVPRVFYAALIIGWCILMGRHFYAFHTVAAPLNQFLNTDRSIGSYTFTINGIFVFGIILTCSLFLSRLISYFASEPDPSVVGGQTSARVELGSWLLLIRIIVISSGLFLAIAAAGIPLDRLTLIIGALGVGIGLGLQALVNNLVSGLIIAFEKPVNVGDLIEIDGKTGTMKSIGFRSSVIMAADGSSVVIPNGDLLSQHLVNWSMNRNRKRMNILVGVAYGTNLTHAKEIVQQVLKEDSRILSHPPPLVFIKDFGSSAIDLDIYFWVGDLRDAAFAKSDAIQKIDTAFKEASITIPFPQQEIHIKAEPPAPGQALP